MDFAPPSRTRDLSWCDLYLLFIQEDLRRPSEARPDLELAAGLQPDWSLAGRWRVVRNGVRNLGQQVLEVVIVTPSAVDDAAVRQRFTELLQQLIAKGG